MCPHQTHAVVEVSLLSAGNNQALHLNNPIDCLHMSTSTKPATRSTQTFALYTHLLTLGSRCCLNQTSWLCVFFGSKYRDCFQYISINCCGMKLYYSENTLCEYCNIMQISRFIGYQMSVSWLYLTKLCFVYSRSVSLVLDLFIVFIYFFRICTNQMVTHSSAEQMEAGVLCVLSE